MLLPTDIRLVELSASADLYPYRTPMKFGGRVVTDALVFNVHAVVETRSGRRGAGLGSMPLGNAWAWPSAKVASEQTLAAMREFAERVVTLAAGQRDCAHPLVLMHEISRQYAPVAEQIAAERRLAEPMPRLAQLVAASPLDAAIHDAFGKANAASSYDLLGPEHVDRDLSAFLNDDFRGEYLDRYTLRQPQPSLPLYHLVGALDPLIDADVHTRVGDGLPETLVDWIIADGLTHLKIKLAGDNLAWDVDRVAAVEAAAVVAQSRRGCADWRYSLDFNEKCDHVEYVLEFLARLQARAPQAFARAQYIEQPTHRDLRANPANRMHAAAKIKPVVIDESLVDLDSLFAAREMGYSGVALKACKGHTEALLMGAAAQKYGMFLCVQDLTCPGASFLHSASLAARLPTVAAIEGNGRQYCPAGNRGWSDRFPTMFQITDGTVGTAALNGPGLGY